MNADSIYWMHFSINIAREAHQPILQVGAVLVSAENKMICSAFAGEECSDSWSSVLLSKARKYEISNAQSIFVTINTLSEDKLFDLNKVLKEIDINKVYIGLPDPKLICYVSEDPIIACKNVYRYPDNLQYEILTQNAYFFADSKQSIKHRSYYSKKRISDLVIEKLELRGFMVSKSELNADKRKCSLAKLVCDRYGVKYADALNIVYNALSEAFNCKYSSYDYANDARSLDVDWKKKFMTFYKKVSNKDMSDLEILNVGVGSGNEAIALFSNCTHATFVDIAQAGLKKIKEHLPLSNILVSSACDMSVIPDDSYDLYVSLRTYNSSFFDIKTAISEAHRILRTKAAIIISVANGFLCTKENCIVSGLLIPGTDFVDVYRGMDTIKKIQNAFLEEGFGNIQIFPTNTEIYLSAIVN